MGYTMATVAGDEITEALMRACLVDYHTAERIKMQLGKGAPISFEDVVGVEQSCSDAEIFSMIEPEVQRLADEIARRVLEVNERPPSALFLAGGGSKLAGLSGRVADALQMDRKRVAVAGRYFQNSACSDIQDLDDPEYTTPLGIAVSAGLGLISDSYRVVLNGKPAKLFRSGRVTVLELLMMNGFTHSDLLGITPDQITLIGDSAGGNLAAVVSLMARDRGEFLPRQQILLYPATNNDHTENSPFDSVRTNGKGYLLTSKRMVDYMALYRSSDEDLQNPYYAPILCSDLSDQPRTLIITAEFDPLRDEGEAYGEKLREFGNDVEIHRIHDALHGFMSLSPGFKPVKRTYRYINDFLSGRSDSFGQVLASVADQEDEPEETVIMDKEVNELE